RGGAAGRVSERARGRGRWVIGASHRGAGGRATARQRPRRRSGPAAPRSPPGAGLRPRSWVVRQEGPAERPVHGLFALVVWVVAPLGAPPPAPSRSAVGLLPPF